MKRVGLVTLLLVLGCAPLQCLAGKNVFVRLIEAKNEGRTSSRGIEDVLRVMQQRFPYSSYRLVSSYSLRFPVHNNVRKLGALTVQCDGPQDRFSIVVRKGRKKLIGTTVRLSDRKPFIAFPDVTTKDGGHILVFLARDK